MLVIITIVANNYILYPYLSIFTDKVRVLDLPDKLWTLMAARLFALSAASLLSISSIPFS